MERAVFIIMPAAVHNAKSVIYRLTSTGCQRSVRLTRQQAEQATDANPAEIDNVDQESRIAEYLSGPTTCLIVDKFNIYAHLKTVVGLAPDPPAVDSENPDEEVEAVPFVPSPDSFKTLYGNSFYISQNEIETEKDVLAVSPPVVPGFDKTFLDNAIYPTLTDGLVNLCKEKPENPVAYLGQWLLDHNPNVPVVDSADTA